jgi:CBS-domain-containing membrane protein
MSKRIYVCRATDPVQHALDLMALHQVRRLPVVGNDGALCGLIALDDFARVAREHEGWIGGAVAASDVGRALGAVGRPHWTDEIYE